MTVYPAAILFGIAPLQKRPSLPRLLKRHLENPPLYSAVEFNMVLTMKQITNKCLSAVVLGGLLATVSMASAQSTTTGPTAATTNGASSSVYPNAVATNSNVRIMPTGKSPAGASAGAVATPQSGNYPGTGSSVKHTTSTATPTPAPGQSPAQASTGAVATPKSGNYPGTGSGQQ